MNLVLVLTKQQDCGCNWTGRSESEAQHFFKKINLQFSALNKQHDSKKDEP